MMLMVRKAGMALVMLFQSIWAALIIISDPVRISAGPVQYTGMEAVWQSNVLSIDTNLDGCVDCAPSRLVAVYQVHIPKRGANREVMNG